jgi:hypothetical protein
LLVLPEFPIYPFKPNIFFPVQHLLHIP